VGRREGTGGERGGRGEKIFSEERERWAFSLFPEKSIGEK